MRTPLRHLAFVTALSLACGSAAFAASAKTYQVTGPVVDVTPTTITIQKGDENWEIARDANVRGDAALKAGDRVTVHYRMVATRIESKSGKADEPAGKSANPESSSRAKKK